MDGSRTCLSRASGDTTEPTASAVGASFSDGREPRSGDTSTATERGPRCPARGVPPLARLGKSMGMLTNPQLTLGAEKLRRLRG